ncbi:hypothetical protein JNB_20493 [Janibacter sp. HTCC2649]|uniref:hypothetical protein n=1 Tax=Janibacter sp. HTCC2649 TaxID=313589 RepID=UPI000066F655|nr:hypothetical protein [Janibacter sp. HTCC2649]EAP97027.1 hypothetical protein JNB_20493 [Janibacter sp. HTCC2649]
MSRRTVVIAAVIALLAMVGASVAGLVVMLRGSNESSASPGPDITARTPSGALTFTIPATWRTLACPTNSDSSECLRVAASGMPDDQAATVSVVPRNPVEGTPLDLIAQTAVGISGVSRIVVDGLPAGRVDPPSPGDARPGKPAGTIVVVGRARHENETFFSVACPVAADPARGQQVCDQVLHTLHVTR